ncbi:MAG: alanine--tRNA ligase [bacterium]|nr:alanine--tRNA ligase [bacterium]
MDASILRRKYLEFFKSKGHAVIPGASLIPVNDPTVLFTTAGMHPLVPFLLGENHPAGKRLVSVQKCIRTVDIDEVGDNRHQTFFEMLGNWSLGDYFKKEAIEWSWEFLFDKKYLGLDSGRLYVTVFMGDENALIDQVAIDEWKKQFAKAGIKAEVCSYNNPIGGNENFRIFPLPAKDNWWGPVGQTGPCGPCTEMFYDMAQQGGPMKKTFDEEVDDGRILEFWNDVFMEFNKTAEGKYEKLSQKNVDTGMGLERIISILNGEKNSFDNELFHPIFEKIEELSRKKYSELQEITRAMRIVADHIKAAAFLLAEGLEPSNVERGYVLRRLIRRAVRHGKQLDINNVFTFKIAEEVVKVYQDVYPELRSRKDFIEEQLAREEEKFGETLESGLREARKRKITGKEAFNLYQTYGFPFELSKELAEEQGHELKEEEFQEELKKHQETSRAGAEQKFKGGLADHSEEVVKYHTAAHLILAALRQVLGPEVFQKGSNITAERLRFDFSHSEKMTEAEIKEAEDIVNQKIKENLPVKIEEMTLEEAKEQGAMGVFESKYGERVKVYSIGNFSKEICGGPHVQNTGELGIFKIVKEESSSAGVRRIKAVLDNLILS